MTKKQEKALSLVEQDVKEHTGILSEEHEIRVKKVEQLRAMGVESWPVGRPVNATCADLLHEYKEEVASRSYDIAGRIVALRGHGKTMFAHIQDRTGRLQIYIKQDLVGDQLMEFITHFVGLGDIVWVSGTAFKTKTGEVSLKVEKLELLSKCLHPLPEKFHGIADVEIKYRQRYLDLISSAESLARFKKRSEIVRQIRLFMDAHDFIEVETPMLHPIPGGAIAKPFVTHHNALHSDLYLRIAPELYLKRLVIGGLERVYEINRCFRNEGISTRHNPEFTTIEWYAAYLDYEYMMNFIETMLKGIVQKVCTSTVVAYGDYQLDFSKPFERLTMHDAVVKYAACSAADLAPENIDALLAKHGIKHEPAASWGVKLYALFEELVESKLIQPTYIIEFPVEVSPLSKRNPKNPLFVDRFELFMAGMELANGFNELNDPFDQAERFHEQASSRDQGDQEAHHYDADYVLALEYALPPTVGVGIGIDRLTMLLTQAPSIRDVILFPTLKRKQ